MMPMMAASKMTPPITAQITPPLTPSLRALLTIQDDDTKCACGSGGESPFGHLRHGVGQRKRIRVMVVENPPVWFSCGGGDFCSAPPDRHYPRISAAVCRTFGGHGRLAFPESRGFWSQRLSHDHTV